MAKRPRWWAREFISDWAGLTLGDLFDRIRNTMPQDNPGKLSRDQYADILSFVLKAERLSRRAERDGSPQRVSEGDRVRAAAGGRRAPKPHASAAAPVQTGAGGSAGPATDAAPGGPAMPAHAARAVRNSRRPT